LRFAVAFLAGLRFAVAFLAGLRFAVAFLAGLRLAVAFLAGLRLAGFFLAAGLRFAPAFPAADFFPTDFRVVTFRVTFFLTLLDFT